MATADSAEVLSVSQITYAIKHRINLDFPDVWVTGEISGISRPASGHIYLSLKDESAQLSTIIWRSTAETLSFKLEEGLEILCRGNLDVYPQRGTYQLIARAVHPVGQGALQLAFVQLYQKLKQEGLFDETRKQTVPSIPVRIAVVTSPAGAAIHDFLQVVHRRWPWTDILVVPARVQGPGAAEEIAGALNFCGKQMRPAPDVIVVTRGGGSIEDLWCFNEEALVRAIVDCPIPVVSAVGHEIDVTLCDLAADLRALTPSEAGEKVVPDQMQVHESIEHLSQRLNRALVAKLDDAKHKLKVVCASEAIRKPLARSRQLGMRLDGLALRLRQSIDQRQYSIKSTLEQLNRKIQMQVQTKVRSARINLHKTMVSPVLYRPLEIVIERKQALRSWHNRLVAAQHKRLEQCRTNLRLVAGKLAVLNPVEMIARGYSSTTDLNHKPIRTVSEVQLKQQIRTTLTDGILISRVEDIEQRPMAAAQTDNID